MLSEVPGTQFLHTVLYTEEEYLCGILAQRSVSTRWQAFSFISSFWGDPDLPILLWDSPWFLSGSHPTSHFATWEDWAQGKSAQPTVRVRLPTQNLPTLSCPEQVLFSISPLQLTLKPPSALFWLRAFYPMSPVQVMLFQAGFSAPAPRNHLSNKASGCLEKGLEYLSRLWPRW